LHTGKETLKNVQYLFTNTSMNTDYEFNKHTVTVLSEFQLETTVNGSCSRK